MDYQIVMIAALVGLLVGVLLGRELEIDRAGLWRKK
jgi:hypothetical protein